MNKVIEVKNLTRSFKGKKEKKTVIDNISFEVYKGEIFGLLGPNGAGKSTTIKILTTLLLPSSGSARILGYDVESNTKQIRRLINFVYGGERGVYGRLTAKQYMYYFCTLYKIPLRKQYSIVLDLIKLVGLEKSMDQKIHTFSKGMKQRLHIARCLINNPKVLFLDEPTIGLDPVGAKMLRNLVKTLSKQGITIMLTTHYMQEADELCNRIAFINEGRISLIGDSEKIKQLNNDLNLFVSIINLEDLNALKNDSQINNLLVKELKPPFYEISFHVKGKNTTVECIHSILKNYGEILDIKRKEITLEDAYFYHMKKLERTL